MFVWKQYTHMCTWKILKQAVLHNPASKRCNLCLWEKYYIICKPALASLNKRKELIPSQRHAGKYLPKNVQPWDFFSYLLLACHQHSHFHQWHIYYQWWHIQFKSACRHKSAFGNNFIRWMQHVSSNKMPNLQLICSTSAIFKQKKMFSVFA